MKLLPPGKRSAILLAVHLAPTDADFAAVQGATEADAARCAEFSKKAVCGEDKMVPVKPARLARRFPFVRSKTAPEPRTAMANVESEGSTSAAYRRGRPFSGKRPRRNGCGSPRR